MYYEMTQPRPHDSTLPAPHPRPECLDTPPFRRRHVFLCTPNEVAGRRTVQEGGRCRRGWQRRVVSCLSIGLEVRGPVGACYTGRTGVFGSTCSRTVRQYDMAELGLSSRT